MSQEHPLNCIKKRLIFFIVAVCSIMCCESAAAQVSDTRGTDFWVGFMAVNAGTAARDLDLFATAPRPCTVTVTNPNTGWSDTLSVSPAGTNHIAIPYLQAYHSDTVNGQVVNKGLHVTATDTICLFSTSGGNVTMDITNVFPTLMQGSDYMVQSFPTDIYPTEFLIVAAEDSVVVDITMSCATTHGWAGDSTYTVTLPAAGKSLQVQGVVNSDVTGTRITARDGKKIAVFNGAACAYVPGSTICHSCDNVFEQAVPVQQWGTKFVARGSERLLQKVDRVRITALEGGCQVRRNGTLETTLGAGQSYLYTMSSADEVDYFETSEPAVAYEYLPSLNDGWIYGDPSMITLPPIGARSDGCPIPHPHIYHQ